MSKLVFRHLQRELLLYGGFSHTKHISMDEQLAIFLRLCRDGDSSHTICEGFQRSPDTVSKIFHCLLDITTSKPFYTRYVRFPRDGHTPQKWRYSKIFFPFFEGCIGAIDGTHIEAF
ncbi:hypothetical protein SCHPADRAFT_834482, partial [Schizopora paradoxa]